MRARQKVLALFLLFPSCLIAEEVRVRLYTAHPPASISIQATEGILHWRQCPTCEERTGQKLSVAAPANDSSEKSDSETEFLVTGSYELRSNGAPSFFSQFPLRLQAQSGVLLIVVTMPLETYLQHVLMAESGDFRNPEAMKAMAIAARTYATKFNHQHAKEGFDFCDTTHCQVFHWKAANDRVRAAVGATSGQTVSYRGAVAATYYHQNCGGTTAAANEVWAQVAEPYLTVHADPFCMVSGGLKWETTLTHAQIDRALRSSRIEPPKQWKQIEVRTRARSGRAQTLVLGGDRGNFSVSASSLRFAVNRVFGWNNIRSDLYEVRNSDDKVLFSGHGAGHGVGLCQAGAEEMARQGKNYREILNFYYPGTELSEPSQEGWAQEAWEKRSDERFDLLSAHPDADSEVLSAAERLLREAEGSVRWKLTYRVKLQIYPSLDSYRNATGQPGWVAASTRGRTIRLQPLTELKKRGVLESTLRHELNHLLIESRAKNGTPLWFREGLVLYLSSEESSEANLSPMALDRIDAILAKGDTQENTRHAYQSAQKIVAMLIRKNGREKVLGWLSSGLPGDVLASVGGPSVLPPSH